MRPQAAVLTLLALMAVPLAVGSHAKPLVIEGEARVVDGRTIEIWGQKIQIWGLSVPDAATEEGRKSKLQLQRLLADVVVRCESIDDASLRYLVAKCYVGDIDIAWPMVLTGNAQDDPGQSGGHYAQSP